MSNVVHNSNYYFAPGSDIVAKDSNGNPILATNTAAIQAYNASNGMTNTADNTTPDTTPSPSPLQTGTGTMPQNPIITPGAADPKVPAQINVADYASEIATDPTKFTQGGSTLTGQVAPINPATAGTNINAAAGKFQVDPNAVDATTSQVGNNVQTTAGNVSQIDQVQNGTANSYDVAKTYDQTTDPNNQMQGAQGVVNPQAVIDTAQTDINTQAIGSGFNADGSVNQTGQALQQYASQSIGNIIDTSTQSGKDLAAQLGEGNYIDAKATAAGQLAILQQQFVNPQTGEPQIPAWAAGTARNVSKIASFTGMTGTAATQAMSQAIMEASLPIAQADAQFFQTVTLQNLNNKQASTINRASVLAKMDLTNADNRMAAAIQNSKNFMDMDMKNLDNRQQAELVNTQARIQSILEDSRQENVKNNFVATAQNDMDKYYDELNSNIEKFNSEQKNAASQFDAKSINDSRQFDVSQANAQSQFNSQMENNREQYYKNMQYNIEVANAKWRQDVTLTNDKNAFEAASLDVRQNYDISKEQLSQIWDRSDSLLDYLWKSTENEADRKNKLALQKLSAKSAADVADAQGKGSIIGSIVGAGAGKFFDWAFS